MKRRDFIVGLGGAAAWPVVARAQQKTLIGFISPGSLDGTRERIAGLHKGLRETASG
jgi:hypothetical protein